MPFCQSSSNRFSPWLYDMSVPKFLALTLCQGQALIFEVDLKSNQKVVGYSYDTRAPLHQRACLARKVIVVAHWFTAGKTDDQFFSSGSKQSTFQHYENYSGGIKPPSHCQFNVSTFYDSSVRYLQQQGLILEGKQELGKVVIFEYPQDLTSQKLQKKVTHSWHF